MEDIVLDGRSFHRRRGILLALLLAMSWSGAGLAATTATPDPRSQNANTQTVGKPHPPPAHVAKHGGKADPVKATEFQGKGAKPPVGEKPHPPVSVTPVVPKQAMEPAEPPLPLPRFASLKTDETNMRRGPGQRYPIDWVYRRRDLPVEVQREYDVWRYVRDPEGIQGWVHEVTLSEQRRTFMVRNADATIRDGADDKSGPVAVLKVGVIGRFRSCDAGSKWCQVQAGGYKGYLRRDQVWGLLPDDVVAP